MNFLENLFQCVVVAGCCYILVAIFAGFTEWGWVAKGFWGFLTVVCWIVILEDHKDETS